MHKQKPLSVKPSHLCKVCQQRDALYRLPQPHLVCQDSINSLQEENECQKLKIIMILLTDPDGSAHLLIKVSQPVHSLELVALQFAIEDGGLWDVIACVDGRVGEAVALAEP